MEATDLRWRNRIEGNLEGSSEDNKQNKKEGGEIEQKIQKQAGSSNSKCLGIEDQEGVSWREEVDIRNRDKIKEELGDSGGISVTAELMRKQGGLNMIDELMRDHGEISVPDELMREQRTIYSGSIEGKINRGENLRIGREREAERDNLSEGQGRIILMEVNQNTVKSGKVLEGGKAKKGISGTWKRVMRGAEREENHKRGENKKNERANGMKRGRDLRGN